MTQLWSQWMEDVKGVLAAFYIDGHVRVYYGEQTELPRHYVARQKLCLRATTDYWLIPLAEQATENIHHWQDQAEQCSLPNQKHA